MNIILKWFDDNSGNETIISRFIQNNISHIIKNSVRICMTSKSYPFNSSIQLICQEFCSLFPPPSWTFARCFWSFLSPLGVIFSRSPIGGSFGTVDVLVSSIMIVLILFTASWDTSVSFTELIDGLDPFDDFLLPNLRKVPLV